MAIGSKIGFCPPPCPPQPIPMFGTYPVIRFALAILVVTCAWTATAIPAAGQDTDPQKLEFFEKNVRPVLVQHCYECHAADEVSGGLLLDSRSGWQKGGDSGPAIVSGDPDKSLLIEAVRYTNRDLQMPPQNQLSPSKIQTLEKWVAMGAARSPSGGSSHTRRDRHEH